MVKFCDNRREEVTDIAINPGLPKQACTVDWNEFAPLSLELMTMRLIVQSTYG
jgi:hypothetical protein